MLKEDKQVRKTYPVILIFQNARRNCMCVIVSFFSQIRNSCKWFWNPIIKARAAKEKESQKSF